MKINRKFMALGAFFLVAAVALAVNTLLYPPQGMPILAYHMINEGKSTYSVSPALFEEHMQYLQQEGYTAISLLEFAKAKKGKFTLPQKPVVITFDDGYEDNYTTALPILEKYGIKASVFMVVNDIGRKGYLSLEQLKEMERRNIEIGSHTANHLPLAKLSSDKKQEEIAISKLLLEWKGLKTVFFLAYPNGSYDDESQKFLKDGDYLGAVSGNSGLNTAETNPYLLHRINVPNPMFGLSEFKIRMFKADVYAKLGL